VRLSSWRQDREAISLDRLLALELIVAHLNSGDPQPLQRTVETVPRQHLLKVPNLASSPAEQLTIRIRWIREHHLAHQRKEIAFAISEVGLDGFERVRNAGGAHRPATAIHHS